MTEPNEPATPLSRMRFSWQRGTVPPEGEATAPPPAAHTGEAPQQQPPPQQAPQQPPPAPYPDPPVQAERAEQAEPPGETYESLHGYQPPPERPATRLGRASESAPSAPAPQAPAREGRPPSSTRFEAPIDLEEGRGRSDRRQKQARSTSQRRSKARGKKKGDRFEVPKPGGRFSGGRGNHVAVRVILLLTASLLVLGIVGYSAFTFGIQAVRDNDYALSEEDIQRFGLTEFPVEQAGRFAADYARICMTHSAEEAAEEQRLMQLTQYVSSGVDTTCGWAGEGEQEVVDSSWTGASEPIDLTGLRGHVRMMTVRVLTADDQSRVLAVPVYVKDLRSGEGMKVVGDVGEMPQPLLVAPPPTEPIGEVDTELTTALVDGKFFQQYFEAWGASDAPSVNRFVTPEATDRAHTGLSGTLQDPTITEAQVFFPAAAGTDGVTWSQGDQTEAWVWVTWRNPDLGTDVTVTRAYRVQLVMTEEASNPAQSWAVQDVRGGVPSVETE